MSTAEIAVEGTRFFGGVLDINWRLLQGEEKSPTRRGRARQRRKVRDIPELHRSLFKRNGGQLKKEGSRLVALERSRIDDVGEDHEAPAHEIMFPVIEVVGYSQNAYQYEERRRRTDLDDLDPVSAEKAIMIGIETERRHARERLPYDPYARRRFLRGHIADLETQGVNDVEALLHLIDLEVELAELESLMIAA